MSRDRELLKSFVACFGWVGRTDLEIPVVTIRNRQRLCETFRRTAKYLQVTRPAHAGVAASLRAADDRIRRTIMHSALGDAEAGRRGLLLLLDELRSTLIVSAAVLDPQVLDRDDE